MATPLSHSLDNEPAAKRRYDFKFAAGTPYGHAAHLIEQCLAARDGLIIDLGCGQSPIAEPLQQLGFDYVGLDFDPDTVAAVQARGIDARVGDLSDFPGLGEMLTALAEDRPVAAVLMLDVIEHLPRTRELLSSLREALALVKDPPLVVSVPNVAHFDVGARLLMGQFEMTETGLLDETHISFFTEQRLTESFVHAGFHQVARHDFRLMQSDQHIPASHPALAAGCPMSQYLRELRQLGGDTQDVNQFIRVFQPGAPSVGLEDRVAPESIASPQPSLTVLLRTQGRRMGQLEEALTCLAAQTVSDVEVIVLAHSVDSSVVATIERLVASFASDFADRVVVVRVDGGGLRGRPLNVGLARATGGAIAFFDDDDLITADWAEVFVQALEEHPGHVARSVCLSQLITRVDPEMGSYRAIEKAVFEYPERFDPLRQIAENTTPFCAFAVDRFAIMGLGISFDENLPVLEDWDFLMKAALPGGVIDTGRPTAIYHRWFTGPSSSDEPEAVWRNTRGAIMMKLDNKPLLLPRGSASTLRTLYEMSRLADRSEGPREDHSGELRALRDEILRLDDGVRNWKLLAELRESEINRLTRIERQPIVRFLLSMRRAVRRKAE